MKEQKRQTEKLLCVRPVVFSRCFSRKLGVAQGGGADRFIALLSEPFTDTSCKHANDNYDQCVSLLKPIERSEQEKIGAFMKERCKFFVIALPEDKLSEAFQLFDSQNQRGKALDPHDLLKAYHLRAIDDPSADIIEKWEGYVKNEKLNLKDLFDKHLFRVRRWSLGSTGLVKKSRGSELRFSERFLDDFKGVDLDKGPFPYLKLYRQLKDRNVAFPCSITMPIINGEAFLSLSNILTRCSSKAYRNSA